VDVIVAILALLAPAVVLGVLLVASWRRGRLGPVFLAVVALLAGAWALSAAAQATDFRDADGWVDCWPHCSLLQEAVGRTLFYAPIDAVLIAVLANALAFVDRRRRRGSLLP
jgi:ABC-type Fe3+ transport system permease subunit